MMDRPRIFRRGRLTQRLFLARPAVWLRPSMDALCGCRGQRRRIAVVLVLQGMKCALVDALLQSPRE